MKKLLLILFCFPLVASAQNGKDKFGKYVHWDTLYLKRVVYNSGSGVVALGIDTVAGSPTFGQVVRKTASEVGSGENIYNTSAMLTGNRTLTGNAHTFGLTFDSLNTFAVRRNNITRIDMTSAITSIISPNGSNAVSITNSIGNINVSTGGSGNLVVTADSVWSEDRVVNVGNLHGLYTAYTLVDKSYVDSVVVAANVSLNKGLTIELPSSAESIGMWKTPVAITVTSVTAVLVGSSSPSVTMNIAFGTDRTSGTNVFTSGQSVTSTTTGHTFNSGFNDATIPAGSFIWFTTSAVSGVVTNIEITIHYTED